ncbi:MAG TPA: hypothetical protein VEQ65_07875, partial [Opitutus sp.]|nr:hypothetical protein [Opitutus sp.]
GQRQSETIIPRRALFGNQVFVVEKGRVRLRQVEVGYTDLTFAEIVKGLNPGDQVIVEEVDQFSDGDRVRAEVVAFR